MSLHTAPTPPVDHISGAALKSMLQHNRDGVEIVDVREPAEHQQIRIKGSRLIPMQTLMGRLDEIDWNKEVVLICRSGSRSGMMANMVAARGKKVKNLRSGILECYHSGGREHLEFG